MPVKGIFAYGEKTSIYLLLHCVILMKKSLFYILILFSLSTVYFSFLPCLAQPGELNRPFHLQCEHMVDPVGIDAVLPRLSWQVNDFRISALQTGYHILVDTDSAALRNGQGRTWNSGKVTSTDMQVTYAGAALQPFTRYYWSVTTYDKNGMGTNPVIASFETGFLQKAHWKGSWITDNHGMEHKPAPYFRKVFDTGGRKIKTARAYVAVAGLFELTVNGEKAGNHCLDPMYTRFDRRTLYVTHDVTRLLQQGKNAVGVLLGNGWYNHQSTAVWYFHQAPWRARPSFCMDLRITYEDGSEETISSDNDWKTSTGPLVFNSIYTAEHYDARLEQPGWNTVSFDDTKWSHAVVRAAPSQQIVAQVLQPIRRVEAIKAKSITKFNDTTYVFDLGRNIAGVSSLTVEGQEGTVLHLKHGERLYKDGHVDQSNINVHYRPKDNTDPFQTDIFILGGKGKETFTPRFNYKGFQYIEVTSSKPVTLTVQSLTGYFMHSDVPVAGTLTSSSELVNKLWAATNNSYLSNLFGYPTDCPQREKNGWTGDAHIALETGLYGFDGITIYEKWLADHRDEQQPNGLLPSIIPTGGWGYQWGNGPDWTSTIAIIPWNIYLFYGDSKLLSDCYDNIRRYVDHITDISPSGLTTWGLGDWVPVSDKPPVEFTSSVYYYADASILAKAAKLLGKEEDFRTYTALADKIREAFNTKYLNKETGVYGNGMQTEQSAPLYWGLVPDEMKARVAASLARRVAADNNHMNVGILGGKALLNALSENGYAELAYQVITQETYPAYGWWIKNGATTLYENWKIDAQNDISLNHIMFGEASAWFYKALAGICPDAEHPGFKNTILKPNFPVGLEHFEATHEAPVGKIVSGWRRKKNVVLYHITVPANATASLYLPQGYVLTKSSDKGLMAASADVRVIQIAAGDYNFELKK